MFFGNFLYIKTYNSEPFCYWIKSMFPRREHEHWFNRLYAPYMYWFSCHYPLITYPTTMNCSWHSTYRQFYPTTYLGCITLMRLWNYDAVHFVMVCTTVNFSTRIQKIVHFEDFFVEIPIKPYIFYNTLG